MKSIAFFITPHGFGHATRACAVMAAMQRRWPHLRCEIFTQVPSWLFEESLEGPWGYHDCRTDIGLVQRDALRVDLEATLAQLDQLLPFSPALLHNLAHRVRELNCQMVFCDIAPLGVAVARTAGLPSVVVENFTWDWIYQGYVDAAPGLQPFIDYLAEQFMAADVHVQTQPICRPDPEEWPAHLMTPPVSRLPRGSGTAIRSALGIAHEAQIVLVTMGGMDWTHNHLEHLASMPSIHFVFTGGAATAALPENVHFLEHRSNFYHPDLVAMSDAVVGKIGYSTLAEVYHAGTAYGYIPRARFRESAVLADFVQTQMSGLSIAETAFVDGSWIEWIPALLALPRGVGERHNGGDRIAEFVGDLT